MISAIFGADDIQKAAEEIVNSMDDRYAGKMDAKAF
jgi:hypothetical protein